MLLFRSFCQHFKVKELSSLYFIKYMKTKKERKRETQSFLQWRRTTGDFVHMLFAPNIYLWTYTIDNICLNIIATFLLCNWLDVGQRMLNWYCFGNMNLDIGCLSSWWLIIDISQWLWFVLAKFYTKNCSIPSGGYDQVIKVLYSSVYLTISKPDC